MLAGSDDYRRPTARGKNRPESRCQSPRLQAKDQNGEDRDLDEFLKKGKVALVFYRSASW